MLCLKCKSDMRKINLQGVLTDHCPICDGMWLDRGELEKLEREESESPTAIAKAKRQELEEESREGVQIIGVCPRCQSSRLKVRSMEGVTIDYCEECHGMFFDHGELKRVLAGRTDGFFTRICRNVFGMA